VPDLVQLAASARIFDLAQPLYAGVPHFPTHPPFAFSLTKQHGEIVLSNGGSSASELIALGGHTGTHIDALCHFSCGGRVYGGAELHQSPASGVSPHSVDTIAPIVCRGVLLDIAGHLGVDALAPDFSIGPEHLEAVLSARRIEVRRGDVVLLRTGWGQYWSGPRQFVTGGNGLRPTGPGPEAPGARWLSARGVFAAGSDTLAFERVPASDMPVHVHLLVESGIHIIENLNLEELARERIVEFLFVAAPLKIRGGTGSPIRPLALVVP
jgi:kynurenine formamidase